MTSQAVDDIDSLLEDAYVVAVETIELVQQPSVPRVTAAQTTGIAALARTLSHLRALRVLLREGHFVEGRMVARGAIENLFLLAALSKDSEAVLSEMREDHHARRKARGEFLISRSIIRDEESRRHLQAALARFQSELTGRRPDLEPKRLAHRGDVADAYVAYAEMSEDSAHPSIDSLSRYVPFADDLDIDLDPPSRQHEIGLTKVYFSMALIASIVALGEILDLGFGDDRIAKLWERHKSLSASQAADPADH